MKPIKTIFLFWIGSLIFLQGQTVSLAQTTASIANLLEPLSPEKKALYDQISEDLRCPTCTGLSVLQSDAVFSLQIRKAVLDQVIQGKSKKEIMQFFTERYGLWILREPPTKGFHFFAWLVPIFILIMGPFLLWFFVWRKRQTVSTFGIRSSHEILEEFETKLTALRIKTKQP